MIPVTFPECNVILAMGQDEYEPLQAYRAPDGQTICAFRLSPAELAEIAKSKTIWISHPDIQQSISADRAFDAVPLRTRR